MVGAIRIYVEGGPPKGFDKSAVIRVREGFDGFFNTVKEKAREKNIEWRVEPFGGRDAAFKAFQKAVSQVHDTSFNILLVDAEQPVEHDEDMEKFDPWQHLQKRDPTWKRPKGSSNEQCHLMVQTIEAWLMVDKKHLRDFYGKGLKEAQLPSNPKVEEIPKIDLKNALKDATHNTQQGKYNETRHCPKLLKMIEPNKVRKASKHCDRLFITLERKIVGKNS